MRNGADKPGRKQLLRYKEAIRALENSQAEEQILEFQVAEAGSAEGSRLQKEGDTKK